MGRLAAIAAVSLVVAGSTGGSDASMSGWFVLQGGTIYCGTELFHTSLLRRTSPAGGLGTGSSS